MDEHRFKVGQVVESHTINKREERSFFFKGIAAQQFNTSSSSFALSAEGLDHLKVHANQRLVVHWGTN